MNISFHGACREVTGSCHLVETETTKFLIDCGLFQGEDFATNRNLEPFSFDPRQIDFVVLTHAHMDHCGRLPKLYKEGFRGPVYCTAATMDFASLMLHDSAKVIAREAVDQGRKPLYRDADVSALMNQFKSIPYGKKKALTRTIDVCLRDAGHILGSAIVELWITEMGKKKKVVFSGDLGNPPAPIVRDTEFVDGADVVVIESTYGGRIHEPADMRLEMLREAVVGSVGRGGALLIPAFALERTQEVLYELNSLAERGLIPHVPIFVDSPLAIKAIDVYRRHQNIYDKDSLRHITGGDDIFAFPGLVFTSTVQQSKKINVTPPPKVIIAGSGMLTGGRMPYHLKFNLSNRNTHLLIISYQVEGSIGRRLLKENPRSVVVDGQTVRVNAKVSAIGSYSAHADQPKLLHWVKKMSKPKPRHVFIVHGEEKSGRMLQDGLSQKLDITAELPEYGKIYSI